MALAHLGFDGCRSRPGDRLCADDHATLPGVGHAPGQSTDRANHGGGAAGSVEDTSAYDFVATQVGLLSSRSLAERVAQDLNLANNPEFVDQELDPQRRLQVATSKIEQGLQVIAPDVGQLIQFNYVSDSPRIAAQVANGVAEAFINSNLQRRYESSAYARN